MNVTAGILAVVLLVPLIWLLSRIRGVWRGDTPAPPIPFRTRGYSITARNFPMVGAAVCCLLCAFEVGFLSFVFKIPGDPDTSIALALFLPLIVLFVLLIFIAVAIDWIGRPKSLIPPSQREEHP